MKIDKTDKNHIIADDGLKFQRISDGIIFGNEIYLGKTYYINGEKLAEPIDEKPEDFKEIEDIKEISDDNTKEDDDVQDV